MDVKVEVLKRYLGHDDFEYLGCGCYAYAYAVGDRVVKITTDKEDYLTAKRLKKHHKRFKSFVRIFQTKALTVKFPSFGGSYEGEYFIIESERVEPAENTFTWNQGSFWTNFRNMNDLGTLPDIAKIKSLDFSWTPIEDVDLDFLNAMVDGTVQAIKDLRKMGYKRWDNHTGNFALENGKMKIFDFGVANKNKKIKIKTKIKYDFTL